MHFLYIKYKIRKDWNIHYFVICTDRSHPKFGKFGEIGALNSERLKHPDVVTSPPEGSKPSKKGQTDIEACQKHGHAAVGLKDFYLNLIYRWKIHSKPLKGLIYLFALFICTFYLHFLLIFKNFY